MNGAIHQVEESPGIIPILQERASRTCRRCEVANLFREHVLFDLLCSYVHRPEMGNCSTRAASSDPLGQ